jgi:hypothetical protein
MIRSKTTVVSILPPAGKFNEKEGDIRPGRSHRYWCPLLFFFRQFDSWCHEYIFVSVKICYKLNTSKRLIARRRIHETNRTANVGAPIDRKNARFNDEACGQN